MCRWPGTFRPINVNEQTPFRHLSPPGQGRAARLAPRAPSQPLRPSRGRAGALFLCSIIDSLLPLMGYAAAAAAQLAGHHAVLKPLDDPVDLSPGQVQKKRRRRQVGGLRAQVRSRAPGHERGPEGRGRAAARRHAGTGVSAGAAACDPPLAFLCPPRPPLQRPHPTPRDAPSPGPAASSLAVQRPGAGARAAGPPPTSRAARPPSSGAPRATS